MYQIMGQHLRIKFVFGPQLSTGGCNAINYENDIDNLSLNIPIGIMNIQEHKEVVTEFLL